MRLNLYKNVFSCWQKIDRAQTALSDADKNTVSTDMYSG